MTACPECPPLSLNKLPTLHNETGPFTSALISYWNHDALGRYRMGLGEKTASRKAMPSASCLSVRARGARGKYSMNTL